MLGMSSDRRDRVFFDGRPPFYSVSGTFFSFSQVSPPDAAILARNFEYVVKGIRTFCEENLNKL